jgi:hypothetical protein
MGINKKRNHATAQKKKLDTRYTIRYTIRVVTESVLCTNKNTKTPEKRDKMKANTSKKPAAKKPLTKAQKSEIARKAAKAAWDTMNSKAYLKAKKAGRPAVEKFLANRKAA